ncbi:MAG: HAMP domain-containing histidine kinase [Deltaproteobacteria bacterium]|nr:MAG: HAMP domain-containing histidine kinase [Deltaproteobacteria bacterium]
MKKQDSTADFPQDNLPSPAFMDRIIKNSRLSLLGQMTAGLTHELKNPLAVIRLKLDMLTASLQECNEEAQLKVQPHIQLIEKNIQKIINITDQIRNFSAVPDEKYNKININLILAEITNIYSRFSKESVGTTMLHLEASHPEFYGNKNQIEQIFLNLIQNAQESFKRWGQGSTITIRTKDAENGILIDVIDDGIGIPSKNRSEIFNPFFSTKEDGTGMGLGLTTVEKIIHHHGGTIELLKTNAGTHFQILLPHDRRLGSHRK